MIHDFSKLHNHECEELICTGSVSDLLYKYKEYAPLWDVTAIHVVKGVNAQLKPAGWREMLLEGETVDEDSHFILDGVLHGFKIVDPHAVVPEYETGNYSSATVKAFDFINNLLLDELGSGKLSLVKDKPRCVHALGAVPKATGGYRPISDASRPEGCSINAFMSVTFQHFQFSKMDDICRIIVPHCFLAVSDIAAAYRSVLIRPEDRKHHGLRWRVDGKEQYIVDNCVSFGTRAAPFLFNRLTDSITRYMLRQGYVCFNYLDDFLVMGLTYDSCQDAQLALHALLRRLGFFIAYKKVSSPSRIQRYLGIEIDTVEMKLRLPEDKLVKLKQELSFFYGRRQATRKQLQRLCGILSHCSSLVRGGRTFSHRVIELLKGFPGKRRYITLSKGFHKDLEWWAKFSRWFNGEARIIDSDRDRSLELAMDASGRGYGVVFEEDWLAGAWEGSLTSEADRHEHLRPVPDMEIPGNINVQEFYPLIEALWRWGPAMRDSKIVVHSDNTQVVAAINSGRSENKVAMFILRRIFWLSVLFNCHVVSKHIPGRLNVTADALSRLLYDSTVFPSMLCCSCKPEMCRVGPDGIGGKGALVGTDDVAH